MTSSIPIFALQRSQRRRKKGIKNIFEEIRNENFQNLKKETDIQVKEAHTQKKLKPVEPKQTHIKTYHNLNGKFKRILKAEKGEKSHIQENPHKAIS